MPLAPPSTADLIDLVAKSGVVSPDRLAEAVPDPAALPDDPKAAARVLIQRGVLTRFQAEQLLLGRHKGFRLGAYVILEVLGRGGMGAVYLAEHTELHRKVAIKVLVVGKGEDQKLAAERFLREARAVAALDHPNIVRIFDVSRHNDLPFLVMEYVEGETLQQVLDRDGSVPYATAADAVAQAAAGLQHAHEKGFVHRDIKPANLIRDRSGTVKVLDMGLARLAAGDKDKLTERLDAGAVVGTADFISPEQALNAPNVDVRADIYSLGATFFALVTGRPPFDGNTAQKLLHHQISPAPLLTALDPTLPKGLAAVASKMLAKKPADRFQTPAELIAALAPWLGNSTKVLAGLSKTNLGQGAELHAALDGLRRGGSSRRLNTVVIDDEDDAEVGSGGHDTTPTGGPRTTRTPPRKGKPARKPSGVNPYLVAAAGVVLLGAGVAVGLLAFGDRGGEKEKDGRFPDVGYNPPQQPGAAPSQPMRAVLRLDPAGLKPFRTAGGFEPTGALGRDIRFVPEPGAGEPAFPPGWSGHPWGEHAPSTRAEYWSETADGRPALGMRLVGGGTAMILSPDVRVPDARCRVRFEYRTDTAAARVGELKFKEPDKPNETGILSVRDLAGTGGAWRAVDFDADLKGKTHGFFEWHAYPGGGTFLLRGVEVSVPAPPGTYAPLPLDAVATATTAEPLFDADKSRDRFSLAAWGPRDVAGVPFVLAAPRGAANNVVLLRGAIGKQPQNAPERVTIPVGRPAAAVHFLAGVGGWAWPFEPPGGAADEYKGKVAVTARVVYADGRPADEFPWVNGEHVADWIKRVDVPGSEFAFLDDQSHQVRYLAVRPSDPGAEVKEVELVKGPDLPDLSPLVLAVTVEAPEPGTKPRPAPAKPDGKVMYRFDPAGVPPFRVTKEHLAVTAGGPERLPDGVQVYCWKDGAAGEFRCGPVDGAAAVGLTNLSDKQSAQLTFELEAGLRVPLRAGKDYRVRVEYQTRNDAAGAAVVQTDGDYQQVGRAGLGGTGGAWKAAQFAFTRPDKPVRLTVDNTTTGEGNVLFVRSVEVTEVEPAGASPATSLVNGAAPR